MGSVEPQNPNSGNSIKFPLGFSAALASVAALVTLVVSAGGTQHGLRWDLAGIAFGIAFVATLLIASLLVMGHKENDPHLSEGSGVNRRSSDIRRPTPRPTPGAAPEARGAAPETPARGADDGDTSSS